MLVCLLLWEILPSTKGQACSTGRMLVLSKQLKSCASQVLFFFKKDARFAPYFRYGVIRNGSIAMRHARSPVTKIVESRKAE